MAYISDADLAQMRKRLREADEAELRLAKLDALEAAGVDNWEGYDFALEDWNKQNSIEILIGNSVDDLNELLLDADVDQPAGTGHGYCVMLDEQVVREFVRGIIDAAYELSAPQSVT